MTIAVADITRRMGNLMNDSDHIRWTDNELFDWINDGATAIVNARPMANANIETVTLVAGAEQNIDCVEVLDIVRNTGGAAISRTDRFLLDTYDPDWYTGTEVAVLQHYTFDERERDQVYVYPPAIVDTQVEALLSKIPTAITSTSDNLELKEDHINSLVNYILFRCYSKDDEVGNGQAAANYYQAFMQSIGMKTEMSGAVSPNRADP